MKTQEQRVQSVADRLRLAHTGEEGNDLHEIVIRVHDPEAFARKLLYAAELPVWPTDEALRAFMRAEQAAPRDKVAAGVNAVRAIDPVILAAIKLRDRRRDGVELGSCTAEIQAIVDTVTETGL